MRDQFNRDKDRPTVLKCSYDLGTSGNFARHQKTLGEQGGDNEDHAANHPYAESHENE